MVGIIVISESRASREMLKTVKKVLGTKSLQGIIPLVMDAKLDCPTRKQRIVKTIRKLKTKDGVLIMTELYGSTQNNVCIDFLKKERVELISGYNLPMLIKAATLNQALTPAEIASEITRSGKKYIQCLHQKKTHGQTAH